MTDAAGSQAQVILGDTMGQLIYLYGVAQIAFIGGSLVKHGGHNPIEAAATGLPLIMGPHDFNFTSVVARSRPRVVCIGSWIRGPRAVVASCSKIRNARAAEVARGEVVANNAGATEPDRAIGWRLEISGSSATAQWFPCRSRPC